MWLRKQQKNQEIAAMPTKRVLERLCASSQPKTHLWIIDCRFPVQSGGLCNFVKCKEFWIQKFHRYLRLRSINEWKDCSLLMKCHVFQKVIHKHNIRRFLPKNKVENGKAKKRKRIFWKAICLDSQIVKNNN